MAAPLRIGAVGVDSSHLPEFTKRINALHSAGGTRCEVTAFFDPGGHDMPEGDVKKWREATLGMGVSEAASMEALLGQVDGVMVLAVSGHKHLALAKPSLARGLPTYVDKPLTCALAEAVQLLAAARAGKARCYSASSLRFAGEVEAVRGRADLGKLAAIDAFGPGELHPLMPGLLFYGVHTIEMVDAIWGPGVKRVSAVHSDDRDLLDLEYHDGRYARLRMERKGCYDFGATVHGEKGLASFKVDFADVYNRLVKGMTRFFEGGPAPAELRDIVENVAVMEAGNASMARDGAWVDVAKVE
jgi:predicted dehydrogenase